MREHLKKSKVLVGIVHKARYFLYKYIYSDERLIKNKYKEYLNRTLELDNPVKFNDKLQWLKLNWYDTEAVTAADKYKARDFVKERIGAEYLNELYAVYESVEQIDISELPDSFVLKGTHGSGYNIICLDKHKIDWEKAFKKMEKWLSTNYFWENREWVYKDIKPRIICEKLLVEEGEEGLRDYRFFCFDGDPKFITVDFDINEKEKTRRNLYDLKWNLMDEEISYPKELDIKLERPAKLNEMIELSKKLSEGFPHARVDFYYVNNKIYFGEITFFHQSGLAEIRPEKFEVTMGNWLKLPEVKNT